MYVLYLFIYFLGLFLHILYIISYFTHIIGYFYYFSGVNGVECGDGWRDVKSGGWDGLNVCGGCGYKNVDMSGIVKGFGRVKVVELLGIMGM